jgi:hypothetical protein
MGKKILFIVFLSQFVGAADLAVSPLLIDLTTGENRAVSFEFSVTASEETEIRLSVYDMVQSVSGHMDFVQYDDLESKTAWVSLPQDRINLRRELPTTVVGELRPPARSAGDHLVAVMVEEVAPDLEGGVQVNVRYAVILNLSVEGRASSQRLKGDFGGLTLVEQEGFMFVEGWFESKSSKEDWLVCEIQIRDENRRLVDTVELKTESAWQRQDPGSRVFPSSKVRVYGRIKEPLNTGSYSVLVRNRFGDRMQPAIREEWLIE